MILFVIGTRPETLTANYLVHTSVSKAKYTLYKYNKRGMLWDNSLGDGKASMRIVKHLVEYLNKKI